MITPKRIYLGLKRRFNNRMVIHKEMTTLNKLSASKNGRIFYLGITPHSNLGDMAQHYCIGLWIEENYPEYELYKFEARTVVSPKSGFLQKLQSIYSTNDIIIFQSGYTTQDLGGVHEQMHRMVIDAIPDAKILMMPQTIFFQHEDNRLRCSINHSKAHNMLFLARDFVSYKQAKDMFHGIRIAAYPDIVTTLIGTLTFNNIRNGVMICKRNDGEEYYTSNDIEGLIDKISKYDIVNVSDTSINVDYHKIRNNLKYYIEKEIEKFSHYKVTITDRYHGTIFSLIAGTPVIILKTSDHKVTTGADWFKGIYDDYVYVAEDLNEAFVFYKTIVSKPLDHKLPSFMKEHYYDKLKELFEKR